jgi:hypothetical protein
MHEHPKSELKSKKHPCEPMDGYKQVHVWMDVQISLYMNEVKRLKYLNMATRLPPCPRPLILVMPPPWHLK